MKKRKIALNLGVLALAGLSLASCGGGNAEKGLTTKNVEEASSSIIAGLFPEKAIYNVKKTAFTVASDDKVSYSLSNLPSWAVEKTEGEKGEIDTWDGKKVCDKEEGYTYKNKVVSASGVPTVLQSGELLWADSSAENKPDVYYFANGTSWFSCLSGTTPTIHKNYVGDYVDDLKSYYVERYAVTYTNTKKEEVKDSCYVTTQVSNSNIESVAISTANPIKNQKPSLVAGYVDDDLLEAGFYFKESTEDGYTITVVNNASKVVCSKSLDSSWKYMRNGKTLIYQKAKLLPNDVKEFDIRILAENDSAVAGTYLKYALNTYSFDLISGTETKINVDYVLLGDPLRESNTSIYGLAAYCPIVDGVVNQDEIKFGLFDEAGALSYTTDLSYTSYPSSTIERLPSGLYWVSKDGYYSSYDLYDENFHLIAEDVTPVSGSGYQAFKGVANDVTFVLDSQGKTRFFDQTVRVDVYNGHPCVYDDGVMYEIAGGQFLSVNQKNFKSDWEILLENLEDGKKEEEKTETPTYRVTLRKFGSTDTFVFYTKGEGEVAPVVDAPSKIGSREIYTIANMYANEELTQSVTYFGWK